MKQQGLHLPLNTVTLPLHLCAKHQKRGSPGLFLKQTSLMTVQHSPQIQQVNLITRTPHIPLVSYQHLKLTPKRGLTTLASIYLPLT